MSDFQKLGEFALPFIYAVTKMKKAVDAQEGCYLTTEETKATVEALQLLRQGLSK